jgi:hypothetical protein
VLELITLDSATQTTTLDAATTKTFFRILAQ